MRRTFTRLAAGLTLALGLAARAEAQSPTVVDLELALLVDVSGSVDASEFQLQMQGYVQAFQNSNIFNNFINTLPNKSIAVTMVQWSSAGQQQQIGGGVGGWYLINSVASSQAFATAVNGFGRAFSDLTAPGSAINFVVPKFSTNAFAGNRWVIDVSGDGAQNDGANTSAAGDAAILAGVDAINGLAILGESGLQTWYTNNILKGNGAFLEVANGFGDFSEAVERKIGREIVQNVVPEPSTYVLMATGMGLMGLVARRRRTNA